MSNEARETREIAVSENQGQHDLGNAVHGDHPHDASMDAAGRPCMNWQTMTPAEQWQLIMKEDR